MTNIKTWRDESMLTSYTEYKKRFALLPKTCTDGTKVWLKPYYTKYVVWGEKPDPHGPKVYNYGHIDIIEHLPEDTYLVRRLIEGF